jgi:chorismate--pyruvate lyase
LLFAQQLQRRPLHCKTLRSTDALYQIAAAELIDPPLGLWARRSLFLLRDAPLLVTEVFLPEIRKLTKAM